MPKLGTLVRFADGKEMYIECTTSINPTFSTRVTESKTEEGSVVSDHMIEEPVRLSISGIFTNVQKNQYLEFYDRLKQVRKKKELITIVSTRETYKDFAMTELSPPQSTETGQALFFNMDLIEYRTAVSKESKTPIKAVKKEQRKRYSGKITLGRKQKRTPSAKALSKSASIGSKFTR